MLDAADYYTAKEDLFIVNEDQKLRLVGFFQQLLYTNSGNKFIYEKIMLFFPAIKFRTYLIPYMHRTNYVLYK